MILYNLKSAFRYILKFRSHTRYSLVGLVIGLACIFVISAWSVQELRFDRFHHQADHIYMVTTDIKDNSGNVTRFPETSPPLAAILEDQIPQVEIGFRFLYLYGGRSIGTEAKSFKEAGLAASPKFLEVLNFPLISGVAGDLDERNSIFLSRSLADKMFPEGNPVSKEIQYKDSLVMIVRGVFKDVPRNSSLQFDFLIPYEFEYGISDNWWQLSDATFIKTSPSADIDKIQGMMKEIWRERITDDQYNIGLIPIPDLRYGADFEFFNAEHGHGNRTKLYMFMGVALLILVLACLNYLNLISAHAVKRENEIWIRKVQGASSRNITQYFIIESVLISVFAWILAFILSVLGIRIFERLMGVVISSSYFYLCSGIGLIIAITIVGLASGFYPAIRAGSDVLLGSGVTKKPNFIFQRRLKNAFVLSQFILSIALSVSSLMIMRQADFMMDFDTGYSKQDILAIRLPANSDKVLQELKDGLNASPEVEAYSFAGSSPVNLTFLNTMEKWKWEGLAEGAHTSFYHLSVSEEYLKVFDIALTEGRFFSSLGANQNRVVINEKLAGLTGFENPVGQILRNDNTEYEIIGVVRDFNFQHLSVEIQPLLFTYKGAGRNLFVKMNSNQDGIVGRLQGQISGLFELPVGYSFVNEEHEMLYKGDQQILTGILFFTILCVILSSLGLIGLVSYGTSAMSKEIALRKVFGSETRDMMVRLNLNILKMFVPGLILGGLIAWLIMREWLSNFAYRKGMELWVFLLGALITLIVALLSVSIQTWKAAKQSPTVTLRS